jgi:O-antigen/teichoic acid export membrane protein
VRGPAKHLTKGVAIYGAGDAIINVVNFGLMAVYVKGGILTEVDYAALALIGVVEAYAKIVNRWGLDGAFMRFYYEREAGQARQRMTSTILWSMAAVNGVLLVAALAGAGVVARWMKIEASYLTALRLMLVNITLMAFTFVPLHAMRMERAAATYSAFAFARSLGTVILRVLLVIGLRTGIAGMYLTDLLLTVALLAMMWPWFRPLVRFTFSMDELRRTLRFGLPRVPAGLASQTLDGGPRLMLASHFPQREVGIYQNGSTLGTGVAFFKSAFETAWAPFYYETSRRPDAKETFSKMATYGIAVFVLLVAGTTAVAHDVILLVLKPDYLDALTVVPLIAAAMALQGVYQLTSIGLNLTSRTEFYSASTITAAGVSVAVGWWLIPRYGVTGAAVTVLTSYVTQAVFAFAFAQRLYPVRYETGRIVRVVAAGAAATLASLWLTPARPPLTSFLLHGTITVVVFIGLLWGSGFLRATERAFLREMLARMRQGRAATRNGAADAD